MFLGSRKLPSISQHTHLLHKCLLFTNFKMCSYPLARQIIYFIVIWKFQIYVTSLFIQVKRRKQIDLWLQSVLNFSPFSKCKPSLIPFFPPYFFRWGRDGNFAYQIDVLVRQMTMICFNVLQSCWLLFVILGLAGFSYIAKFKEFAHHWYKNR